MSGFYLMHRGWMDNGVFADEPYSEQSAWCWMIEAAQWKDGTVSVLGAPVELKRGQFSHSIRFMAERFKWPKSKVERFLAKLTRWQMIETRTETGQFIITLCNYTKYQDQRDKTETAIETGPRQDRDKEEINKQVKQEKEYVATRARGENFFREIYDAGSAAFPYLATRHTEVINRWLEAGADPERDILPLFRQAKAGGKEPRSWNYFTGAVMDAISAATKPLPQGNAANHKGEKKSMSRGMMEAAARAAAAVEGNKP